MEKLLGVTAYARHKGVTHGAVQKALKTGRIERAAVRDIDGNLLGINVALADEIWPRTTDPIKAEQSLGQIKAESPRRRSPAASSAATADDSAPSYYEHRARAEEWRAKTLELDYRERVGELIRASDVMRAQAEVWSVVIEAMRKIFDRADTILASLPAAAHVRSEIRSESRKMLDECSRNLAVLSESALEGEENLLSSGLGSLQSGPGPHGFGVGGREAEAEQ